MIEKMYCNNKPVYMLTCDNCLDGIEVATWEGVMAIMRDDGWIKKLVDGKFNNYCPECGGAE